MSDSDLVEAELLMRRAVKERAELFGPSNPSTLKSRYSLGLILFQQAQYAEAEAEWLAVESGYTTILGAGHPETLWTTRLLASVCFLQGRKQEGIERCRRLLSTPLPEHPGLAEMLREQRRRAVVLIGERLRDDAGARIGLLRDALEIDPNEKALWLAIGEGLAERFAAGMELADLQGAVAAVLFADADRAGAAGPILQEWISKDSAASGLGDPGGISLGIVLERIPLTALQASFGAGSKALKALRGE